MIHLLEMALVDGINVVADVFQPTTASALVDILPVDDCCSDFVDDYKKCHLEGIMLLPKISQLLSCNGFSTNLTTAPIFFINL